MRRGSATSSCPQKSKGQKKAKRLLSGSHYKVQPVKPAGRWCKINGYGTYGPGLADPASAAAFDAEMAACGSFMETTEALQTVCGPRACVRNFIHLYEEFHQTHGHFVPSAPHQDDFASGTCSRVSSLVRLLAKPGGGLVGVELRAKGICYRYVFELRDGQTLCMLPLGCCGGYTYPTDDGGAAKAMHFRIAYPGSAAELVQSVVGTSGPLPQSAAAGINCQWDVSDGAAVDAAYRCGKLGNVFERIVNAVAPKRRRTGPR